MIFKERKLNNKINVTVSKIVQKIRENGDEDLNYYVRKFDKIKIAQNFVPLGLLVKCIGLSILVFLKHKHIFFFDIPASNPIMPVKFLIIKFFTLSTHQNTPPKTLPN